jgi:hypothetical protein
VLVNLDSVVKSTFDLPSALRRQFGMIRFGLGWGALAARKKLKLLREIGEDSREIGIRHQDRAFDCHPTGVEVVGSCVWRHS